MASLVKNAVWNMIRVGSNVLFPLITFPYTSRVLGPAVKGEFEYVYAIVSYFILFANLGFPIYGIRETSKNRNSRKNLSDTVSAIFTANLLSVLCAILVYLILILIVPDNEKLLFFVFGFSVVLSCIQFDWFYQGVEDFKYITIRSIIIKALSLISLFTFVKNKDDLIAYAIIVVFGEFGNNIFNLLRIGKYADLKFSLSNCSKHVKGASALFLGTVAVSIYVQLNTVMLGILDTKESVGYFSAGNKLIHMILSIITAMLSTVVPRITYQLGTGKKVEGNLLQLKVFYLTLYIGYPIFVALLFLADDVVMLLAGNQFRAAIPVLMILSILVIIIPLSNFFGLQVLFPIKKEIYGTYAVVSGAIVNLLLNYVLVVNFSFIGIAISVVIAEFVVTYVHYHFARKFVTIPIYCFFPINCLLAVVIMAFFLATANTIYPEFSIQIFSIKCIIGSVIYLIVLLLRKDALCLEIVRKFSRNIM